MNDGVGEKTKGGEKTVSIKRFPKPPANAWGGTTLSKKIVDGGIKNSNSKKGRGVDETAPFTKLGGEGGEGRGTKLATNPFAAERGVSAGRRTATQLAGKTRAVTKQKANKASGEGKGVPVAIDRAIKTTGSGGREAALVKGNQHTQTVGCSEKARVSKEGKTAKINITTGRGGVATAPVKMVWGKRIINNVGGGGQEVSSAGKNKKENKEHEFMFDTSGMDANDSDNPPDPFSLPSYKSDAAESGLGGSEFSQEYKIKKEDKFSLSYPLF